LSLDGWVVRADFEGLLLLGSVRLFEAEFKGELLELGYVGADEDDGVRVIIGTPL
jgi:hypothetical protein